MSLEKIDHLLEGFDAPHDAEEEGEAPGPQLGTGVQRVAAPWEPVGRQMEHDPDSGRQGMIAGWR
jgi:hypothetical protein